jgi:phosphatidylserine/phosphatidylglycerophosphate/cardiolipin synthase-like enzyme/V8-like Glu-specific endopeptidase
MNVVDVIEQTMLRAGAGRTRRRGMEEFERIAKNWQTVESPGRVLSRMKQLGMRDEVLSLTSSLARGERFAGFNPLERIVGQSRLMSSFFLPLGAERTKAVGRIVTKTGVGVGTGFLVSPRLLMTNNHVIESERIAGLSCVEFDYVLRFDGSIGDTQLFNLLPAEFFLTSESLDGRNLDYTIVAVEAVNTHGHELGARGFIPLSAAAGGLVVKELANIIQHPGGDVQQVALRDNEVVKSLDDFIHYEAGTMPGSSGSPVFNDQWRLAALHHSGIPDEVSPGVYRLRDGGEWDTRLPLSHARQLQMSGRVNWISNEGILIGSIVADARARLADDEARLALFEEAVREQPSPLAEGVGRDGVGAARVAASAYEAPARAACGSVTWTIPLQVTVQLGPELSLSQSGGLSMPAPPSPPRPPAVKDGTAPRQQSVEPEPAAALGLVRELLERRAGVLEVRDGFLWRDGLMAERRAAVVVLDPCVPVAPGDPYEALRIPREIDGLPVDITLGGPAALLRAAARGASPASESSPPADLFQERVPRIGYVKPEGPSLDEVREPMEVVCHVSPDDGWPVLSDFLSRTRRTLTIGIFDLSAPHVVAKLRELAEVNADFRLNLSTQRRVGGPLAGVKKNDLDEEEVIEGLRGVMGERFRQAYVNVSGDGRTFAGSYHIKAAVRDGEELWLSSGNMQSSNQPPPDVHPAAGEHTFGPLRLYNREWHVVVKSPSLARTFEAYLLHDLETTLASPAAPPPPDRGPFIQVEQPALATLVTEEAAPPRYFAREVFESDDGAPVTVQPLLTPDNYIEHVTRLVGSARRTLFIQNQSLNLLDPLESNEDAFVELWRAVKSRQDSGVDVRMIFRVHFDEDEARAVKDRLVKFGLRPERIRVQRGCHTKGVVVDSEAVLVGSHNWTNHGVTANRDASLIFRHPEIASYYERVFLFDWERLAREPRPAGIDALTKVGVRERAELARPDLPQPAWAVRLSVHELFDD